jgi:hypothetical protein
LKEWLTKRYCLPLGSKGIINSSIFSSVSVTAAADPTESGVTGPIDVDVDAMGPGVDVDSIELGLDGVTVETGMVMGGVEFLSLGF